MPPPLPMRLIVRPSQILRRVWPVSMPHRKQQQKAAPKLPDEFAAAKAAMTLKLTDPESARFDQLFRVTTDNGEAICGLVNSKNRMGGYIGNTGFIFEKALNRATLMFSGASDPDYTGQAAAAYCVYCTEAGRGDRNIVDHCPSLINSYRR
jgi:hypothetical protein